MQAAYKSAGGDPEQVQDDKASAVQVIDWILRKANKRNSQAHGRRPVGATAAHGTPPVGLECFISSSRQTSSKPTMPCCLCLRMYRYTFS